MKNKDPYDKKSAEERGLKITLKGAKALQPMKDWLKNLPMIKDLLNNP